MKSTGLIILFLAFYSCTCHVNPVEPLNDYATDCEYPIKFDLDDQEYQGHPYRDVNLNRNLTLENAFKKNLGDKKFYLIEKTLGSGTFGSVFKAIHTPTQDSVALKVLVHSDEKKISKEVHILRAMKDAPNFLPLRDVLREEEDGDVTIGLIFDYFAGKNFADILPTLDAYQMKVIIYQTIKTLEYAHSKGIMHRDIKPLNVLMDPENLQVRVIDWGQAEFYSPAQELSVKVSTLFYKGPELILNYSKHDYSLDVWSTGCMLAEMAFKKNHFFMPDRVMFAKDPSLPDKEAKLRSNRGILDAYARVFGTKNLRAYAEKFKDDMNLDNLNYIGDYEEVPLTDFINEDNFEMIHPQLIDLLYKMLVFDHSKRITMKEALEHPYFDEVRDLY